MVGWHKLAPNLRSPPLIHNGTSIHDPITKAETLQKEVLGRFSKDDDLTEDPLDGWVQQEAKIQWDTAVSAEEAEKSCIGVQSTSPGTDGITVRVLTACWTVLSEPVRKLYHRCLELSWYPKPWKRAEVVMLPKAGKRDKTNIRS